MARTSHTLLLLALLSAGCATTTGPAGKSAAAPAESVPPATSEGVAATPGGTMDATQRAALQTVLDVMHAAEWQTARELAQELILNYPTLAEAYANMGNIQQQLGEGEQAEQAWHKALQLHPGWAALYNQQGLYYREQGRFEEALAAYQQALAADQGYARAHRNIAILYEIYLGEEEKALTHYLRYQELTAGAEQEVTLWIADLERRVGRSGE